MVQHQLQKNCFRDPPTRLSNASLISQSVAVTCTHQRMEAPLADKVIYELFGSVSNLYRYTTPTSMSALVCVLEGVMCESGHVSCLELRPHCDKMLYKALVTHLKLINIQLAC